MNTDTRKMILVTVLCGLGYMMYSVDRMTVSSAIGLIAAEFGLGKGESGILLSSFFFGFIVFLFIAGIIADKLSGKPVLILGLMLFSFATLLTGVAGSLTSLIFYRVMTGVGEGIFWPAASLEVANVTSEKQRTTVMSLYWMGYPIGGFLGTWMGAVLGPVFGWRVVFYVAGAMGILVALLYAFLVKNDRKPADLIARQAAEKVPLRTLFRHAPVMMMALYYFILLAGWWIVLLWAPSYLMQVKNLTIGTAGTIASLLGLTGALGGFVLGRYCDKGDFLRRRHILMAITIVSGFLMAAMTLNLSVPLVIMLVMLLGFLGYPITPIVLSITAELVPPSLRGSAIGFVMNMGMAAGGISPIVAGYFAQQYTLQPVWLAAAAVILASSLVLPVVRKLAVTTVNNADDPLPVGQQLKH
ncbi:MFS transporter [Scandinavium manionii]|uniref:MFS transporter n=1 Tax=Scandinavium manionii TaxID=2926520 RepID=UPI0013577151|nr:MFS transporter [Scandinavium manionii]MCS2168326.1 MFS transporter [Scandinavium manionii]